MPSGIQNHFCPDSLPAVSFSDRFDAFSKASYGILIPGNEQERYLWVHFPDMVSFAHIRHSIDQFPKQTTGKIFPTIGILHIGVNDVLVGAEPVKDCAGRLKMRIVLFECHLMDSFC